MRSIKVCLWILVVFGESWGVLCLVAPNSATTWSRAPVNTVNTGFVKIAHLLGAKKAFVLSKNAADHASPLFAIGGGAALILGLIQGMSAYAHLRESEQTAWNIASKRKYALQDFERKVSFVLLYIPGDSVFDRLAYAVKYCEQYDAACTILGIKNRDELFPAIQKLLAERQIVSVSKPSPIELLAPEQTT